MAVIIRYLLVASSSLLYSTKTLYIVYKICVSFNYHQLSPIVDLRHSVESVHATASKLDFTLHTINMLIARSWIVH